MTFLDSFPLQLLRTWTLLNGLAVAVLLAALLVFGRDWPPALARMLVQLTAGAP